MLHGAHCFSALQGDYVSFKRYLDEGMEIATRLDDRSLLAITLNELGIISQEQGDNSSAQAYYEESLFWRG